MVFLANFSCMVKCWPLRWYYTTLGRWTWISLHLECLETHTWLQEKLQSSHPRFVLFNVHVTQLFDLLLSSVYPGSHSGVGRHEINSHFSTWSAREIPEDFPGAFYITHSVAKNVWVWGSFCGTMQVQVAHLQPDEITLVGEGVFPRIGFDLPSQLLEPGSSEYTELREMAYKSTLTMDTVSNAVRCC